MAVACSDVAIIAQEMNQDGNPVIVAECYEDIRHGLERNWRECQANARLIAAAPELLGALQAIVDADERGELCHDQIAQAHDALAKARGGTP